MTAELDPPAERLQAAAFVARGLADELQQRLAARGSACTQLVIGAETEHAERHERVWRTEGAFGAAAIADRVRWQVDAWLISSQRPTSGLTRLWLAPEEIVVAGGRQLAFSAGGPAAIDAVDAAERAARAVARVQAMAGPEAIQVPERRGGRSPARFLPRTIISARTLPTLRLLTKLTRRARRPDAQVVSVDADVSVHVFRPASARHPTPALLWIHGGGMVLGDAAQDSRFCRRTADQLNIVVASVEYRLAPEHPFPTPLEDCYTALQWLARQPDIDPARIAVGGASAGGGLAAALALLAKERGEIRPVLQLLSYPMLDDRTTTRTDIDPRRLRIWSPRSNRFGWRAYLGPATADGDVPPLAAPARYDDLSGLPPAWIGVGTNDLFHDEDVTYARRLQQAGVACTCT